MSRLLAPFRVAVVLCLALGSAVAWGGAARATGEAGIDTGTAVRVYDYDLGDSAFRVKGFNALGPRGPRKRLAPIELTGRVYAPADAAGRRLPLVVLEHGLFWTCADTNVADPDDPDAVQAAWPCRGSFSSIRSDQGYDHLGRTLAEQGMVVVSVGANGVNAGELGEVADRARAAVVFEHLRMWRALVEDGAGPLVGALTDPETGAAVSPDLRAAADLLRVGLLGHSRGGRGVMWAAADMHRHLVPDGVRIRAVFGLAAAEPPFMDRRARRFEVGRVPVMTWSGTCDMTGRDEYNRLARRRGNPVNVGITVHGANHNYLNSRWSPQSGLPGGEDDANHPPGRPGRCYGWDDSERYPTLGYEAEQQVAATYVLAFFGRHLQDRTEYDATLSGADHPVRDLTKVTVRRYRPARS